LTKVLVTGGAGFIGSCLTARLLKQGHHVVVLDNFSTGSTTSLKDSITNPRFECVRTDLRDDTILRKILRDCTMVYHLAANSNVRKGTRDTSIDFEQNLVGTRVLLECMRESANCRRIVFTSTSTVYGEPKTIPTPESYGPLRPISLYGASKLGCEAMISAYNHLFGIESTILRLANVVGPTSNHGVVYDLTRKLMRRNDGIKVFGDGTQRKSYLYVDDCLEALLIAGTLKQNEPEVFNVGSSDSVAVTEVLRTIENVLGQRVNGNVEFKDNGDGRGWRGDVREMRLDCSKLKGRGWKVRYDSHAAIETTVRNFLRTNTFEFGNDMRVASLI